MEDYYKNIYEDLFRNYYPGVFYPRRPYLRLTPPSLEKERRLLEVLIKTIENSNAMLPKEFSLRPDAKHFLLVNFHQMIILPLIFADTETERGIDLEHLDNYIQDDIKLILELTRGDKEISGHQIMNTISSLWSKLKSINIDKDWS